MTHKTWYIDLDGIQHTVELYHGFFSGKRLIKVDGEIIEESTMVVDKGSEHPFKINYHDCMLIIKVKILFHFDLIVDGVSVETGKTVTAASLPSKKPFGWLLYIFTILCQIPGLFVILDLIIEEAPLLDTGIIVILVSFFGTALCRYIYKKSLLKPLISVLICLIITLICWVIFVIFLP